MKKQIAVGKLSISKATNDGSLLHSPSRFAAGGVDKLVLFPAHSRA